MEYSVFPVSAKKSGSPILVLPQIQQGMIHFPRNSESTAYEMAELKAFATLPEWGNEDIKYKIFLECESHPQHVTLLVPCVTISLNLSFYVHNFVYALSKKYINK